MNLRTGLRDMGGTEGKSESQFLEALGPPVGVKTLVNGGRLIEWQRAFPAQMIAVLFDRSREFVQVAACYPSTRATRRDAASSNATTQSVHELLVDLDLRDVPAPKRSGLWARSPL